MPSIRADDEICPYIQLATRRFCADADYAIVLYQQIDDLGLHVQLEIRKSFCVGGDEIEKVPLRHERDEFAARGELGEISDGYNLPVDHGAQLSHFLMRLLQEFIKQAEFVHQLERGRMNGVAAEVAVEIGVLLKHCHLHAGPREQIARHHPRRSATDNHATSLQFFTHGNSKSQGTTDYPDSTDKEPEIVIIALYPCYSCNPWLNK